MRSKQERLIYIDNLRILMIVFVVMIHLAVTYSGFGGWYYKEGKSLDYFSSIVFSFFQSFTQGYFMGFLFLISGYFVPGAYDKKGFSKFIKDRFIRLGIPTLIYMLIINPVIMYFILQSDFFGSSNMFADYIHYITSFNFLGWSGPLWFAFALLIFNVVYAFVRRFQHKNNKEKSRVKDFPKFKKLIYLIIIIAFTAFIIRTRRPIGTSFLNMQLCYFAQYIILFIIGLKSYRNNWFSEIKYKTGVKWILFSLTVGFVLWAVIMLASGASEGNQDINGGLHWQSAAYALWESFVSVGMSVGIIALFKEKYNKQNKLVKALSDSSFAVYMFHAPIIITITLLFKPVLLPPLVKFIIMCIVSIPICFILSHFIFKRIPLLKKVI